MNEKTKWFPAHVKPVHVGVYQVRWGCDVGPGAVPLFSYWDGVFWSSAGYSLAQALKFAGNLHGAMQAKEWRGLTKPEHGEGEILSRAAAPTQQEGGK